MENCLKTQLKGDVQNESLKRLGELKLVVSLPANRRVALYVTFLGDSHTATFRTITPGVKFSLSASGELSDTVSIAGAADVYISNPAQDVLKATIFVTNKYSVFPKFNQVAANTGASIYTESYKDESSDWLLTTNLSSSTARVPMLGTVHDLMGMYNATFVFVSGNTPETTDDWSIFTKNSNIDFGQNVTGDIVKLGACTAITNFAFGNSHCHGTIESWVQAQRANGRTTGSTTGNGANAQSDVTFAGSKTHAKGPLTWTESTITMDEITVDA